MRGSFMKPVTVRTEKDQDHIETLYRMLKMNMPIDKIADWLAIHGIRYSSPLVKRTFKKAERADLIEYFIKEEDVEIGNTVRSRSTSRVGKVVGIKNDGDTLLVKWETGGSQLVSKEGMYKLRNKEFIKVHTELNTYGDIL